MRGDRLGVGRMVGEIAERAAALLEDAGAVGVRHHGCRDGLDHHLLPPATRHPPPAILVCIPPYRRTGTKEGTGQRVAQGGGGYGTRASGNQGKHATRLTASEPTLCWFSTFVTRFVMAQHPSTCHPVQHPLARYRSSQVDTRSAPLVASHTPSRHPYSPTATHIPKQGGVRGTATH